MRQKEKLMVFSLRDTANIIFNYYGPIDMYNQGLQLKIIDDIITILINTVRDVLFYDSPQSIELTHDFIFESINDARRQSGIPELTMLDVAYMMNFVHHQLHVQFQPYLSDIPTHAWLTEHFTRASISRDTLFDLFFIGEEYVEER